MNVSKMRIGWLGLMMLAGSVGAANLTWDIQTGDGGVIKDGSGTWTTGSGNWNTGSGDTTWTDNSDAIIGGGTLGAAGTITMSSDVTANSITFNNPYGGGAYTINGGTRTLTLTGSAVITNAVNSTLNSLIAGTVGLTKAGPGTLTLGNNNPFSYTGGTTVKGGTLKLTGGNITGTGTLTVNSGATIEVTIGNQANNALIVIAGTYKIDGSASICQTLSDITLSGGTITTDGGQGQPGWGFFLINAGKTVTVDTGPSLIDVTGNGIGSGFMMRGLTTFNVGSVSGGGVDLTINGPIQNSVSESKIGSITKTGTGTMLLSGTNTYTGVTTINQGVLRVDSIVGIGAAPTNAANLVINGGTLQFTGTGTNGLSARLFSIGTSGGTLDASGTGALNFSNVGAMGFNSQTGARTITLTGTSTSNNTLAASIGDNSGATSLTKSGAGTWVLSGSNALTGAITVNAGILALSGTNAPVVTTTVNGGTLSLTGAGGRLAACTNLALSSGGTLKLDNTTAANNTDRLKDTATVTMNGGTFLMSNDGGATNFSETVGVLTVASGINSIYNSLSGQSNILTFASLTRTGGSVDFSGPGLGTSNQIRFTSAPTTNGLIGYWATYGGTNYASYDTNLGVIAYATANNDIANKGSTINDGWGYVRITSTASGANIGLSASTTSITSLQQNVTSPATVDTAGKVFRASSIMIGQEMGALTIGAATNDGILTAQTGGGTLTLVNNSTNVLTINACITNNAGASALSTMGNVVLNGTNSYTGTTAISGSLTFGSAATQTISGVINGDGRVVKTGGGRLTLGGANTYTGGTTIDSGATVVAPVAGSLGTAASGPLVVNGTLNLAANASFVYTFGGPVSGNGVINVSASDWLQVAVGTWTAFAGIINITAGRFVPSTAGLPTTATVNVVGTKSQLFLQGGTFLAALTLNAGDFDGFGQFRMSKSSTWSGPVTLYTNATIGYVNENVTISGAIGDNGAHYGIILTGASNYGGTLHLSGTNTYSGDTRLTSGGTNSIDNALSLQNSTLDMNVTGVDYGLPSFTQNSTLGGLKGSRDLNMSGKTLSIGNNNQTNIYSGVLANGALVKIGSGALTLSGTNTYSGGTTVNNGTLLVNGSITGAVTIAAGSTFGGTGTVAGAVSNYGTISPASTTTNGTLTVSSMTMAENSTYVWNADATANDMIVVNGTLTLPSVATVTVSRATARLPNPGVLFTGFTSVNTSNLSGWVFNNALPYTRAKVVGNQVVLMLPPGTRITFQ